MNAPSLRELRWAGVCYLLIIALGLYGEGFVRASLIVPGDAAATAQRIAAAPLLWRSGLVGDLLMQALDIPVIVMFWRLLRPIHEPLALTATLINLVQTCVLVANRVQLLVPLDALGGPMAAAFPPAQREALALLAVQLHGQGFGIGLIFFGFACLVRGALIVRSAVLPVALGWLLVAAGAGYLLNSFALLLWPPLAGKLFPWVLMPALVGETALALHLALRRRPL